ncbi:MAG: hypothetical protein Fur002_01800 [Anaerolineales bacterium]
MANIIGPDVSFYQDDPETPQGIDFPKMRKSAEFVIVRAGQNLWVDSDFKVNWREAKAAGFPRGSYWFYDSRADPKRQAELWAAQFAGDFGELPLFADFEENYGGAYKGWKNWYTFLERLKQLIGTKEISIYTAYYYWRDNAPNATTQASALEYFHQYPLWIAHYGAVKPNIPKPWGADEWLFWQFTEGGDGKLYGVESNGIDLNYFNGDLETFRARFKLTDAPPPPPPVDVPPGDSGAPTGKIYTTIAQPSLKVREGPGTSYASIGSIFPGELVEEIGANIGRTWLRIRKPDNSLIGWCFATYLKLVSETTPPSDPTPPPPTDPTPPPADNGTPTGKMYAVTAQPSLKVREGPGTGYASIGLLYPNETVEEMGANADRTWLRIRKPDNSLSGWSFAAYLKALNPAPPTLPVPDLDPGGEPVPLDEDKRWYRVAIAPLSLRAEPSSTSKILGALTLDDALPALDESNPNWIQLRRVDGLVGWCEKKNLALVSATRPMSIRQTLLRGVTYLYKDLTVPRKNRMHVMAVDLQTIGLEFLVTPASHSSGLLCTRTTSKFLKDFNLQFAVNGDGFVYLDPAAYPPTTYCSGGGSPVKANGFAASRGKVYSPKKTGQPIVYINAKNQVAVNGIPATVFNALSGDRLVVQNGAAVKNLAAATPAPRTAIGLSKNGRWLLFMVIDGRQPGFSEGVTFPELATQLLSYGAFTGVNMDGGGSSTMVIRGVDGNPRVLNSPVDENTSGKERKVANHLGLLVK